MASEYELDPADFITVGTIGPPGERIFHLQAGEGNHLITLIIEKEQASALAESISKILEEVAVKYDRATKTSGLAETDVDLHEPILPLFRVGQMGLGYDEDTDRLILILNELLPEDAPDEPRVARLSGTRQQMAVLAQHATQIVAGGRPICGNCGRPMDPEGHFCPPSNGHRKPVHWA